MFTKSGTNEYHGTLSEFHTNNALTARTEFQGQPTCHSPKRVRIHRRRPRN